MNNHSSVKEIKGVGEKMTQTFAKLDIYTVEDLIRHYPRDYEQFGGVVRVMDAAPGETAAVNVVVKSIPNVKKVRNLTILNVVAGDESGPVHLTFFNMPYLKNQLKPGYRFVFRGTVLTRGISKVMEQPKIYRPEEYDKIQGSLLPVYGLTKGLTNQAVLKAIRQSIDAYTFEEEYYPDRILDQYRLPGREEAIRKLHFPDGVTDVLAARKRLVFDEFFDFIMMLRRNKEQSDGMDNCFPMRETAATVRFLEALPFSLTKAQKKVWGELREDLAGPSCMNRLIQGDVGSGKTILAFLALLLCSANGFQGALMAPTEVLAAQHYDSLTRYMEAYDLDLHPVLLVGSMTAAQKKKAYARIESGEADVVIGTHALIQEKVSYRDLALVITDEQHRFGVRQRETLADKSGKNPHVLVMSATPIPRTLAIILYGDLHISVIDEVPAERLPIKNCVVDTTYRPKAYQFIEKEVRAGHQAYVICPQVEAGEMDQLENVVDYSEKISAALSGEIVVRYLHGKMPAEKKNQIMQEFGEGKIHVLVSTTVIEVGINVPNATVMMVENADRFGLAQLHQLRGRVGRGDSQSYCIFVSGNEKKETMERLKILNHSNDGFKIAAEDLKLRGPGELFGVRQSGDLHFRIGDIYADSELLKDAACAVQQILSEDPELERDENRRLRAHLSAGSNLVDFRSI